MSRDAVKFGRMSKKQRERVEDEVRWHKEHRALMNQYEQMSQSHVAQPSSSQDLDPNSNKFLLGATIRRRRHLNGYQYPSTQDLNYSIKPEPSYMPTTTTTTVGYDMRIKTEVHSAQPDNGIQILEIEHLSKTILDAYQRTALYTLDQVEELRNHSPDPNQLITYKTMSHEQWWMDAAARLTAVIQNIIEFAKMLPGFMKLSQDDQIMLLKAASFEITLIRTVQNYDSITNRVLYGDSFMPVELFYSDDPAEMDLINSVFIFVKELYVVQLTDMETALFAATILLSPTRDGLQDLGMIEGLYERVVGALKDELYKRHSNDDTLTKLMHLTAELRAISSKHVQVLSKFRMMHQHLEFPALHKELFSLPE
ncbi:PREDICTED: probable nuclear hormone receptor HR3 [Priapulus caudatus]|uniref:Probable nuclear hormone receptor HR3 n=1 Tax=Priapulus caudatus TaxID=37621 RepID=A0ABM1EKV0_PRICU|nr:PREDICTED: probable nuclear hormone receptor HR3 [Priapulus caudatus]